ncbi:hypothetical protein ACFT2C_16720 [Promicromonospora sp. NPDC057138]|uniref:hypothetical protein n=1 Tax=Promicromonospora sp. NPDC057138 TaxID=3346031 RepID=UPI003626E286
MIFYIPLGLIALGLALLGLPTAWEGGVVAPINALHGLSLVDAAGAALLAVGATWLEVALIVRLPRFGLGPRAVFGLGVLGGLGVGLVVASVFVADRWWMVGAGALGVALTTLTVMALRDAASGRP